MLKITKAVAKQQFKKGNLITFVPSKSNHQSTIATYGSNNSYETFEDACADKEHYYCSEVNGRRLAYYVLEVI